MKKRTEGKCGLPVLPRACAVNSVPFLLYIGERFVCTLAGIGMEIPWGYFQLLDRQELLDHPFWSLFFLHSQPPLLNALLACILKFAAATGSDPEAWAAGLFFVLGAAICWGFFRLMLLLTSSFWLALVGVLLLLADPGTHVFQHQFFYPLILQAFMVGVALFAFRYFSRGNARDLVVVSALVVLACNTGSLYHPLWAGMLAVYMGVTGYRRMEQGMRRRLALAASLALVMAGSTLWPLKNLAVFGQFTYSTWEGVNTSRGAADVEKVFKSGWQAEAETGVKRLRSRFPGAPLNVVTAACKCDGSVNWNQYGFVVLNPPLKAIAIRWRIEHPKEWGWMAATQYAMWTRASYADCYLPGVAVPGNAAYRTYALAHQAVFYPDLRWLGEAILPAVTASIRSGVTGHLVPLTLFGVLVFPLVLFGALAWNWKAAVHRRDAAALTCLLMVFCVLWVLVVPCLTDGHEGNRMRFAVDPLILALGLTLAHRAWNRPSGLG